MKKCLIHYFSGIGNTLKMVKVVEREFLECGVEVDVLNIEKTQSINLLDYDTHLFAFPVYGFGVPEIVSSYVSKLPSFPNHKAVVFCTCAGFEGRGLYQMKSRLGKKGFDVIYTEKFDYPISWTQIINPPKQEVREAMIERANQAVSVACKRLIQGQSSFRKPLLINQIWTFFVNGMFSKLAHRLLGKTYIADSSCTGCGTCAKTCPVQAIEMKDGKPCWTWNCEDCQRCMNICPHQAIQLSVGKLLLHLIGETLPIYFIMKMNLGYPLLVDLLLYCVFFVVNTILVDWLITGLEKIPFVKKLLDISYTKKYRRFRVKMK